jgi:hypothetical protein
MRYIALATISLPLEVAITDLAGRYHAEVIDSTDIADLLGGPVALVLDPDCVQPDDLEVYLACRREDAGIAAAPLVLLSSPDQEPVAGGHRTDGEPNATTLSDEDDIDRILQIVEEALLGSKTEWRIKPK